MKIKTTDIEGILIFEPTVHSDSRGKFYELWREDIYKSAGIQEKFCQDNFSCSTKNVLRGLHFQTGNKAQGQLVSIMHGSVFDVCIDLRKDSPSFGHHITCELSDKAPQQVYMPPGIAHGFYVLSQEAILHYKCTQYYTPDQEGGIIWQDNDLNIPWPCQHPFVSDRDRGGSRPGCVDRFDALF